MRSRKIRKLLYERRALSDVIANVILAAAVITVGFIVLHWGQAQSIAYNMQYGNTVSSNIASLQEQLTFENAFYKGGTTKWNVTVYLLNSGTENNVTIKTVSLENVTSGAYIVRSYSPVTLMFFNGTTMAKQHLNIEQQGCFVVPLARSIKGTSYSVIITTGRGSSFENTYVA